MLGAFGAWPASAQDDLIAITKVVMEDGSPLPQPAGIERSCGGRNPVRIASTNKQGEVRWGEALFQVVDGECVWRAVLPGYVSDEIGIADLERGSLLPNLVLHSENAVVPEAAIDAWNRALKSADMKRWSEAENTLRSILTTYPKAGPVWEQLGVAYSNDGRNSDARQAFERAVELAPRYLQTYRPLIQLQIEAQDYDAAEKTALGGIKADTLHTIPALYLDLAEVYVELKTDGAEAAARKAIALDKTHKLTRAEYVLGLILGDGGNYAEAIAHLRRYLQLEPHAAEAASVRSRVKELEAASANAAAEAAEANLDKSPEGASEVAVPGGIRALAAVAHLKGDPGPASFFRDYCRAVAAAAAPGDHSENPQLLEGLAAYFAAVTELARMAENGEGRITLSPNAIASGKTAEALRLFGWRDSQAAAGDRIEPSDLPADAPKQQIPAALGVDEVQAANALKGGSSFRFEVHSGQASILDARAWRALAGGLPPGGFAEMFLRNPRFAAAYAGLAGMETGAASAVIAGVGLRALVSRYASTAQQYGEAFAVADGRVASPGGTEADASWERLAGASPRDPKAFFAAALAKDQGKLAAFYLAMARADAAHQRFFIRDADTAERYYKWYRDSGEVRFAADALGQAWRAALFRDLPLDDEGRVAFPGGRDAWTNASGSDRDVLMGVPALEALVPVANMERRRKKPLDARSAWLLAERYGAWRTLFSYFERLPGLGHEEFDALAAFEKSAAARPPEQQNIVLGEWHSLVKLIDLGTQAGSLDYAAAARAFRRACEALSAPDYNAESAAALREMLGGEENPDEAVPAVLLRLNPERRAAFERVKAMEGTPRLAGLAGATAARTLAAIEGLVYAALLDPNLALVAEDPALASKHVFAAGGSSVFAPSGLQTYHEGGASHFTGGFMTFEQTAANLAAAKPLDPERIETPAQPPETAAAVGGPLVPTQAIFRVGARMVEVYATVMDDRGRYVDDLEQEDFTVLDNGRPAQLAAFENHNAGVSVALVLDTTGSMAASLPALKVSALKLIDSLRVVDRVAVYSFNQTVSELQPFTGDKDLAKRAVLGTRASGDTGLNDALVCVTRDLAGRAGKKAIVVFTDGADNASALNPETAIRRAKSEGVTVYTVAHGDALHDLGLTGQLESIAQATGGLSFAAGDPMAIHTVFEHILRDLMHGYLLAFQPGPDDTHDWRKLQVTLRGKESRKVRAREGYFPQ
jgi:Ca-activated chloride channel family protein